jgi:preprotein translocase subunit SecG
MAVAYILIFIVCIILILVILVQNSKGGGLAANFTGSQVMGVRKTADFLEKATWTLAGVLLFFAIVANLLIPHQKDEVKKSVLQDEIRNAVDPSAAPKLPTAPAQGLPSQESK